MGDAALYRRLLCMFRDSQFDFQTRFRTALATGDLATATRMAHDLKGVSAALGAYEVHHAAAALEQACMREAEDIDSLAQDVADLLGPVIQDLHALGTYRAP